MSKLMEVFAAYKDLSFTDRIVFYTTLSNNVNVHEDNLQDFLIETRINDGNTCIYCESSHIVKNGKRKDGTQRFLCRDCKRSFIPRSCSITSGTRKDLSVWAQYLKCMSDKKTLKETAEECSISVTSAFCWRHKILDALKEVTDRVCLDGIVEADEIFFNVSYKGNHKKSRQFKMPRKAHKRGNAIHRKGLSSEKVCVPCAVDDKGISFARPVKLGKVSSECLIEAFGRIISPSAILCTDNEKAYRTLARNNDIRLIQTDSDKRIIQQNDITYDIQRINAYHSILKGFINRFHGVSTKHLEHYIIWNNLISNNRRNQKENISLMFGQILSRRLTVHNSDISARPPLAFIT